MLPKTLDIHRKTLLITGAAGFIGARVTEWALKNSGVGQVVGIDDLNDYYDIRLKHARLAHLQNCAHQADLKDGVEWHFEKGSVADPSFIDTIFARFRPCVVIHLAAQAGVRYSVTNPDAYMESNVMGFYRILEACRHFGVKHLLYASSSSVYGERQTVPFRIDDATDTPASLYAATKKTDEILAASYASLYGLPCTGLRFFTVYGPAGRPDMAYFTFAERWRAGETVYLYHGGRSRRDYTYIDDVVEAIGRIVPRPPIGRAAEPQPPHRLYNIGRGHPEAMESFVRTLAEALQKADVLPTDFQVDAHMQIASTAPGDVSNTYADVSALERDMDFRPCISLQEGLYRFAIWYAGYIRWK